MREIKYKSTGFYVSVGTRVSRETILKNLKTLPQRNVAFVFWLDNLGNIYMDTNYYPCVVVVIVVVAKYYLD